MGKKFTHEEQVEIAVANMKKIGYYEPYLNAFKQKGIVTMFEGYGGYFMDKNYGFDNEELILKVMAFEEEYGGLVYCVIHNRFNGMDMYSFLYVGNDYKNIPYKWNDGKEAKKFRIMAYVWNVQGGFEEFGDIGVLYRLGGIVCVF